MITVFSLPPHPHPFCVSHRTVGLWKFIQILLGSKLSKFGVNVVDEVVVCRKGKWFFMGELNDAMENLILLLTTTEGLGLVFFLCDAGC